ncbi:NAD(P)/FAD-dependent oxidoreductase [Rhodococcus sp. IEGM 1408]|uniref:flavin-containing monooxygenase n=1 Tax=Rhodococcus sp. IEGM 1408 TaxID=3082220 RepID=UPI002954E1C1|nr:NAD(P)/FAD-dependent oxidoreductase [Rhodococcus sp. IEGM 1408]MDV8000437.1 NAD(P)/FAD-dependent oxidoreductase [Rhodococcus sp. IEGM 1408]
MIETPLGPVDHIGTLVIGAGFGGIAMADRLLREGRGGDLLVVEAADEVGGTWRDNTYPGCACDVPTALYSLSRHAHPDWSHAFGRQGEIQAYLVGVADRIGLRERLVTSCEVTGARWDVESARWVVDTNRGQVRARHLVVATGALSTPAVPPLPGLEGFDGEVFHSARWRHDVDLEGKRVAVVGTGASAVQFVPEIAGTAEHVTVFQRTPAWILPRLDKTISARRRALYRRFPLLQRIVRGRVYVGRELYVLAFTRAQFLLRYFEAFARFYLLLTVRDRAMRRALTPDFSIGCKRVLLTSQWFPALTRPDVTLVSGAAASVTPRGLVDAQGGEHPADVIIFGTGFQPTEPPIARAVTGADGRTLAEHWAGSPRAHNGVSVAGFPNLFLIYGPNTNLGHSSIVYMLESQAEHVMRLLDLSGDAERGTVEVRGDALEEYADRMDRELAHTVWNDGGCSSWYIDSRGRNSVQWPTYTFRYREQLRSPDPADFVLG